ncbi:mitochondrial ATP synthase epsilon chain-domain-containing protein [Lyophyllum atratum]|nr:mitochondrial ATP synthase epsilon chain-domain-containing protein [Lyophyllum atratum]
MSSWRTLFSYNRYSQITARAVRQSFKDEERLAAERRGQTALRFQRWENGVGSAQITLSEEVEKEKEQARKAS